mgnify:CR=1 FL=1
MKKLKTILKWLFGITFLVSGFGSLFDTPIFGLISITIGLFILPPSLKAIENKINYSFSTPIKFSIAIAGVLLMGVAAINSNQQQNKEANKIVDKAKQEINKGNMDSAFAYIEKAKKQYTTSANNKAIKLENEIEKSKNKDYAKEVLAKMTDEEFKRLQSNELDKTYINHESLNNNFYLILKDLSPQREEIIEVIKEKEKQAKIAAKREAERKKQAEKEKKRKKKIEEQFDPWDGSHIALSRLIKQNCRNPDSYEHIKTRYRDNGNSIFVTTKYRAENGFGGMTIGNVSAKVDLEGNVIEIISED